MEVSGHWRRAGLEGLSRACDTGFAVIVHRHQRSFEVMSTFISPLRPKFVYPDSDGQPIADNTLQFRWIAKIEGGLEALFIDEPNVSVAGDLLWYPVEGRPDIRTAPDAMVAIGRPKGDRGSYMQWVEDRIATQVVFEVLSPGNRAGEMERKFQFYERHGVDEYYSYDPDRGDLVGWRRAGALLEEVPQMAGFLSPRLRIKFEPGEGPDNLTIFGPDGERFLSCTELVKQRNADREGADEQARRAAEQAERAKRLAAQLRQLGIEPE
jgi:Uma2 family endonuclease